MIEQMLSVVIIREACPRESGERTTQ